MSAGIQRANERIRSLHFACSHTVKRWPILRAVPALLDVAEAARRIHVAFDRDVYRDDLRVALDALAAAVGDIDD